MPSPQEAKAKLDAMQREDKAAISNTDVGNFIKRFCTIEDEMDDLKAEKKDLCAEMKAAGINMKAFRAAVKEIRKPMPEEIKITVNLYLQQSGQYSLFAE